MALNRQPYVKPHLGFPVANKADPLWRRCILAAIPGSNRGHQVIPGPTYTGDWDYVTRRRSTIFTAGGSVPNGSIWQSWSGGGRGFDNGDGSTAFSPEGWDSTAVDFYKMSQAGGTWACIIRPDAQQINGQIPFFKRRAQPYGVGNPGWCMTGAAGNLWRFNYSDGVTQHTVTSNTVQDPVGTRPDFLIVRLNLANTQLQFFVNGVLESASIFAPAVVVGNPATTEDVKILGYGPLNELFSGEIPFCAFWDYPLSDSLMQRLWADPYVMWRWLAAPQGDLIAPATVPPMVVSPVMSPVASNLMVGRSIIGAVPVVAQAAPVFAPSGGCDCCCAAASLLF